MNNKVIRISETPLKHRVGGAEIILCQLCINPEPVEGLCFVPGGVLDAKIFSLIIWLEHSVDEIRKVVSVNAFCQGFTLA